MAAIDDILVNGANVSKLALRRYLAGREIASAHDHGAVGDGVVDDGPAINAALAAAGAVMLPAGTWRIATPVEVPSGGSLLGVGYATALIGDGMSAPVVTVVGRDAVVRGLRVVNGSAAIKLSPRDDHNWHCRVEEIFCEDNNIGIFLDGHSTGGYRCYWNHFQSILVLRPRQHGILLDKTAGGTDDDTPNANKFRDVNVFSNGQPLSGGHGIYLKQANFMNSFVDCEANVHTDAGACVRVGDNTQTNAFVNLYTESQAEIANVQLDPGSSDTRIVNLFAASAGPAIHDLSGGSYDALGAGWPDRSTLRRTRLREAVVERLEYQVAFVETSGVVVIDASKTFYVVSGWLGATDIELPHPNDAAGAVVTVKKSDSSANPVRVKGQDIHGLHPDGNIVSLTAQYDHLTVVSHGGGWSIVTKGFPTPLAGWTTPGASFTREFNADIASFEDVRGALNALLLDLKTLRVLADPVS